MRPRLSATRGRLQRQTVVSNSLLQTVSNTRWFFQTRGRHSLAAAMLERRASKEALEQVLKNNKAWVAKRLADAPEYFKNLATNPQKPRYLFIGCSDSRVNANEITGLDAGNLFVHRNIGMQAAVIFSFPQRIWSCTQTLTC